MPMLDIFKADAFSLTSLTDRVLKLPYQPGRLGQLGIFRERGVTTTSVEIEEKDGTLVLIPTTPRGGPPFVQGRQRRRVRSFAVPHLEKTDLILADQVQGVRSFGSESDVDTVQSLVDELLTIHRAEHEVTLEHLRVGALQGLIYDADGTTVIYNLFTEFGVAQQTLDFNFTNAALDVRARCVAVARLIEGELGGTPITRLRGLASPEFMDALVAHANVKLVFQYQEGSVLGQDLRNVGFTFGGITWEEYRGSVGGVGFIPASTAFVYPEALGIFATYFSPADFVETVNTIGRPLYAKQAADPEFNRWVKILTQSNPLPLLLRPRAVVKLTMS